MEIPFRTRLVANSACHGIARCPTIDRMRIWPRYRDFLGQRKAHIEVDLAEGFDVFVSAWFLPSKIIGWHTKDDKAAVRSGVVIIYHVENQQKSAAENTKQSLQTTISHKRFAIPHIVL